MDAKRPKSLERRAEFLVFLNRANFVTNIKQTQFLTLSVKMIHGFNLK